MSESRHKYRRGIQRLTAELGLLSPSLEGAKKADLRASWLYLLGLKKAALIKQKEEEERLKQEIASAVEEAPTALIVNKEAS